MRVSIATLFPDLITQYLSEGVLGRALNRGIFALDTVDFRAFTEDRYRTVDDVPFGGGTGMVLKPEPVARAIESVGAVDRRILLSPSGRPFRQADAEAWSKLGSLLLVCGRYEGIDQRIRAHFIDETVSIGDYVLSGGELGALVVLDATLRLVPGVLGNAASVRDESFASGLLEHPHYTRPAQWRGWSVPEGLLSGHHARINGWRQERALNRTAEIRPDLLEMMPATMSNERHPGRVTRGKTKE